MNILKLLPLNKGSLDVLFEIYAEGEDYLRSISKKLKMNPSLVFNVLNKLYNSKTVIKRNKGKEVQYSLEKNRDYELLIRLLEEYHLEKIINQTNILKTMINLLINNAELMNSAYKIYLFGSYVSGHPTEKSDIDILFVGENRKLISKECREISMIIGVDINPLIYPKKKFKSDLSKKEALLSSIVNNIKNRAIIK